MIRALSAPVDIATDASPLAQDRPALLSAQPTLSTSLWAHLLEGAYYARSPGSARTCRSASRSSSLSSLTAISAMNCAAVAMPIWKPSRAAW